MKFALALLLLAVVRETETRAIHANAQMFLTGTNDSIGVVNFYVEEEAWGVVISGSVGGLRPLATLVNRLSLISFGVVDKPVSFQGFHIHSQPIGASHNCTAGGAHFNPYSKFTDL